MKRARALASAVAAYVALAATTAHADAPSPRLAHALFEDARALMAQGKYDEACPKFAESQRLDPGGGTLLNLALCQEKRGAIASAWATYGDALSAAMADRRAERETFARQKLTELAARLPRLKVTLAGAGAGDAPKIALTLDGEALPPAFVGASIPVDPGEHVVVAEADGHAPFTTSFRVAEREVAAVTVPKLARLASPPASAGTNANSNAQTNEAWKPNAVRSKRLSAASIASITVAGLALVTSGATGIYAVSLNAAAGAECDDRRSRCLTEYGERNAKTARTLAWVSTVSLGVAVTGAVLAVVLPRTEVTYGADRRLPLRVGVAPLRGGAEASLGFTFE